MNVRTIRSFGDWCDAYDYADELIGDRCDVAYIIGIEQDGKPDLGMVDRVSESGLDICVLES